MKTVVFGLFDASSDARRVLDQLVASPLDLETVSVVHRDPTVQDALSAEAGLPRKKSFTTGLIIGALAGAALGAVLGGSALDVLGPLLATGMGAVVGLVLGGFVALFLDAPRVPPQLTSDLVDALGDGKTVISVRTNNMATARAIRDLFEAGGSRLLGPPQAAPASGSGANDPYAVLSADEPPDAPPLRDAEHSLFAPPWRRTPFAAGPRRGVPIEDPAEDASPSPDLS